MVQRRCGFRLLYEPAKFIGILAEFFVKEFDRDLAIELGVMSKIHLAHTPRADLFADLIMSDLAAVVHNQVCPYLFELMDLLPSRECKADAGFSQTLNWSL